MSKVVFDQIHAGLSEALAVARGEAAAYKLHVPSEIDVKAIRAKAGMTQKDFASAFGFGLDQIKQWEQGRVQPVQAMRAYLMLIKSDPAGTLDALRHVDA